MSRLLSVCITWAAVCSAASAQMPKKDDLATSLGLTLEKKALPVWTTPSLDVRHKLAKKTQELAGSVFLVGVPGKGHGTAWVLSQEHRLLATNAHVADILTQHGQMWAVRHQSAAKWQVDRAWYHPGVRRYISPGVSMRNDDPKKGRVDGQSPDIAVIQLGEGPALPPAFPMASFKHLDTLFAEPVAMIGFPGHDTKGLPADGGKPQATYHDGVISRLTDFNFRADAPPGEQQFLQHTIQDWGGFSGSPIFLPSGEVVALHNMARSEKGDFGEIRVIPHGVRVDCLWELLLHHGLVKKLPFKVEETRLNVKRWLEEDPRDKNTRAAMKLAAEAEHATYNRMDFAAGLDLCDQAEKLAPDYPTTFSIRAGAYENMNYYSRPKPDRLTKIKNAQLAADNALRYLKLAGPSDADGLLRYAGIQSNLAIYVKDPRLNLEALAIAEKIAGIPRLSTFLQASAAYRQANAYWQLDETDRARRLDDLTIRLHPDSSAYWDARADIGSADAERRDRLMAEMLRKRSRVLYDSKSKDRKAVYDFKEELTAKDERDGRGRHFHHYTFEVEEGYFYQIDMKTPDYKKDGDFDAYLILRDDKGALIREDDDGGGLPHSRIFFTAGRSATFRLTVTSYGPAAQTGRYHLMVTRLGKDVP